MRYIAAAIIVLAAACVASGCLSPDQRAATIEDLELAQSAVDAFVPPGDRHDALAKRLAAAATVEEVIQVTKAAQATTQPSK